MPAFVYEGLKEGRKVKGKISGRDRREVISRLRSEGIVPLSVVEVPQKKPLWKREFHLRKPAEEEIAFVLTQLSVLLSAGIPLSKALELLSSQVEDPRISSSLLQIKGDIERGESISSAFRKSGIYPRFLPEMLTAAETGENLEKIFEIAGRHLETVASMKSKVVSAVTYPAVVILFSLFALFVAVKFVVPRIASVLEGFGRDLPLVTRVVILFSDLLSLLMYLFPLLVLFFLFRERIVGRERLDSFLLRIPGIGRISFYFDLSRFAYTLYMTLSSAVPVTTAFRIAVGSMSNSYLRGRLEEFAPEIERGRDVSYVLRRAGFFPPLFVSLIETGESSGELEKMLRLGSEIYRREALRAIDLWVRMIEPLSIFLIGVIVGVIVVSVLLPLTEITSGIGR